MDVQVTYDCSNHLCSVTDYSRDAVSIGSQEIEEVRSAVVPANASYCE